MERIIPMSMTRSVNATFEAGLTSYVNYITSRGACSIVYPHNFGRYYGNVIADYTGFQAFVRWPLPVLVLIEAKTTSKHEKRK
jgi:endoglucanase